MKQFFLFLCLSSCVNMYATVRTVSNVPSTLAQYNTIQAAVDASASGDTIYVQGSPTHYAGFTILNKRLTIIGPGWSPAQNFQAFKATVETAVAINGIASRKTEIQGLDFALSISILTSNPDSLRFIRNQFESAIYLGFSKTFDSYLFEGNWFDKGWVSSGGGDTITNFLFQNNIFYSTSN